MQAREGGTLSMHTDRDARTERARTRRWAQQLAELARASAGQPAAAEAACHALERTERAAREFDALTRTLQLQERLRAPERDDS